MLANLCFISKTQKYDVFAKLIEEFQHNQDVYELWATQHEEE